MGFFRSSYLYVPFLVLLLAVIVLRMVTSAVDALYFGSILVVLAAGLGYEVLRRRRLSRRDRPPGPESQG
jgi:hypothetical protein